MPQGTLSLYNFSEYNIYGITLVKDLFYNDKFAWNAPLVTHLFPPAIAHQILAIPLTNAGIDDNFF